MASDVELGWSYCDVDVVRLTSASLQVDIMPALGGKIWSIVDRRTNTELLWHNPHIDPQPAPAGASASDYFSGGWDEVFPTAFVCTSPQGQSLPDLGEVWSQRMAFAVATPSGAPSSVVMTGRLRVTPVIYRRIVTLLGESKEVHVETVIENAGPGQIDFIWGSHIALDVAPGDSVEMCADHIYVRNSGAGWWGKRGAAGRYPVAPDGSSDVRVVPLLEHADWAFLNMTGIRDEELIVKRQSSTFAIRFDRSYVRSIWQWMSLGGYRGWHTYIMEPWTSAEPSLADAIAAGDAQQLLAGETWKTKVVLALE